RCSQKQPADDQLHGRKHTAAPRRSEGAHVMRRDDRNALHEGEKRSPRGKKASHRVKLAVPSRPQGPCEKRESTRLSPGFRHINHSRDGEISNGNCEESCEEGSEEGPGQEGRQEGSEEGAGEEGGEEGGSGQEEGPRQEG